MTKNYNPYPFTFGNIKKPQISSSLQQSKMS